MLKALRLVFSRMDDNLGIREYFLLRNMKISFGFVGIITVFLSMVIPVLLFVVKYPFAAIATSTGLLVAILSLFLVLKGRTRLGCSIIIVTIEVLILFVYYNTLFHTDDPSQPPLVIITLVAFSMIVLIPSGILINKFFSLFFGAGFGVAVIIMIILSGYQPLVSRAVLFAASYGIASTLIYFITGIQDQLLKKAVNESESSRRTLGDIQAMMGSMKQFKTELDGSQASISNELDRIDGMFKNNTQVYDSLFNVHGLLTGELSTTRERLTGLLDSISRITGQIESQTKIVSSHSREQESMYAVLEEISGNVKRTDEINTRLNSLAENGRNQISGSIRLIEDIGQYGKKMLDIVAVLNSLTTDTNVLALNASIEASHAGKVGQGFAVVAREIKKLSESSGKHTKDITNLIDEMSKKIKAGVDSSNSVGALLLDITNNVKASYESVTHIAGSIEDFRTRTHRMLDEIRELARLSDGIGRDSTEGSRLSKQFSDSFHTFEEYFDSFNDIMTNLRQESAKSLEILDNISSIRRENTEINRNMNELLQGR